MTPEGAKVIAELQRFRQRKLSESELAAVTRHALEMAGHRVAAIAKVHELDQILALAETVLHEQGAAWLAIRAARLEQPKLDEPRRPARRWPFSRRAA